MEDTPLPPPKKRYMVKVKQGKVGKIKAKQGKANASQGKAVKVGQSKAKLAGCFKKGK